jgi:hypothetical protein
MTERTKAAATAEMEIYADSLGLFMVKKTMVANETRDKNGIIQL